MNVFVSFFVVSHSFVETNFSGDVELGDALISSVEGKANAIEAALLSTSLSQTAPISAPSSTTFSEDSRDGDIFE